MSVLIVYATIVGQTGKIARFLSDVLIDAGERVTLVDAGDKTIANPFNGAHKVILAGSVHERRHPKPFEIFLTAHNRDLAECDTLLLSVSLNAAFAEGLEEAQDYVDEMLLRTGMTPSDQMLVAGAVRTERYDYFALQVLRHVILRGQDFDPRDGPREFTDWDALKSKVLSFVKDTEPA